MESAKSKAKLTPSNSSSKSPFGKFPGASAFAWHFCPGGIDVGLRASQGRRTGQG